MREHAPQSTRFAGAITAATATLAFGYAMANGMGAYIVSALPDPITYVVLPAPPIEDSLPPTLTDTTTLSVPLPLPDPARDPIEFTIEETTVFGEATTGTRRETDPVIPTPPTPPAKVRTAPKLIAAGSPVYPPIETRRGNEGISSLEVCVDASGRVTSANVASTSGHDTLDQAALKWVRNSKFTPAKLDGQPQAVCGHSVIYEWKLNR